MSDLVQNINLPAPGDTPTSSVSAAPKGRQARRRKVKSDNQTSSVETLPSQHVNVPDFKEIAWVSLPASSSLLPAEPQGKNKRARKKVQTLDPVSIDAALIGFRQYQMPVFEDRTTGMLVLHWSRQIGKSYTLAAWAVDRLLKQLQRYPTWLVTVLSNSRDNGAEFALKAQQVCDKLGVVMEASDHSPDLAYHNMRFEARVTLKYKPKKKEQDKEQEQGGTTQKEKPSTCNLQPATAKPQLRTGRIKVLAANPRTARGFSGDLILDEFAFHEDSNAIWEAAEPILSSNKEFLCRIASTGNGKYNMFYRLAAGDGPNDGTPFVSATGFKVCRVTRTEAHRMGVTVFDPNTRQPISPQQARARALDKRAYDQNYECLFNDENMALLTHALISAAERAGIAVDEQAWSLDSLDRMSRAEGLLGAGMDIGRHRDLSVLTVLERHGSTRRVVGMLRLSGLRLPDQQAQADAVCELPALRSLQLDMTGIGLGLVEYLQEKHGSKIHGVNFASTEPLSDRLRADGRKGETARVTEIMAMDLLGCFEDRSLEIPLDQDLHDDLTKPEKITSPGGRVSIAATRDDAGHADHFWSLALAVRASTLGYQSPGSAGTVKVPNRETVGAMGLKKGASFRLW